MLASYALAPARAKNAVLLIFSYLFYAWWRPDFTCLLAGSTCLDFICGNKIASSQTNQRRRAWLVVSISANLGLLCYFKYANFGIEAFNQLVTEFGSSPVKWQAVVLPVGISFITFQTMSYTIDVYRREVEPEKNILRFATYVSLFPQLVAGPIVRYKRVAEELADRKIRVGSFAFGVTLFFIGLGKKVLIANNAGLAADEAFASVSPGFGDAWVGLFAYTIQIYFDFSGYSDMAVGLGAMLGFSFPRNFNGPYRALSITEFWGRWHMTLSSWIRDYLYIPMGGNRGTAFVVYRNLLVSMLLCGLWHGANWTFLVWGAYHGVWLLLERANHRQPLHSRLPKPLQNTITMAIVMVGWCIFRADTLEAATRYLGVLAGSSGTLWSLDAYWTNHHFTFLTLIVSMVLVRFGSDAIELARRRTPVVVSFVLVLGLVSVTELLSHGFSPFLYFQF